MMRFSPLSIIIKLGCTSPVSSSLHNILRLLLLLVLLLHHRGLLESTHHILLQCFLLEHQSVFVPDKVWCFYIKSVSLHAPLKQPQNVLVVWVAMER